MTQVIKTILTSADLELATRSEATTNTKALAQYIRALMQNWRQGTVACKDRSEVSFSNKKPWKQKGTGRARAGSPRSPLWRKGGVIFGPQERVRTLKVTKNHKKEVFSDLLWSKLEAQNVISLNWSTDERPKTALAYSALKQAGLADKKVVLFVSTHDFITQASFANIPNVSMIFFDQPNAFTLAHGDSWMFLAKDRDLFKEMVGLWS
ncbi:MAG: 50S ribosomal protein L4 [Candidatus Babeliaceae bacterium]|nr:50S ribosomal protein L4 [Candidatus Babeliaceae bacterium]